VNDLQMPTTIVIGSQQPFTANEMSPMNPKPTLYMRDQYNETVHSLGSEADPWVITASIASGDGGLVNNVTCEFKLGLCVFENLAIDTMGEGYSLEFTLTYPGTETNIDPVVSDLFDVEGRTLSTKFTQLNTLNPVNQTFTVVVSVWDDALDEAADGALVPSDATCTISVMGVSGVDLMGTLTVPITNGNATFSDLEIPESVTNAMMAADCSNPTGDFLSLTISDVFNVHPYPKTGTVRDATAAFTYNGPIDNLDSVLDAFSNTLGVTMMSSQSSPMVKTAKSLPAPTTFAITSEEMSFWPDFSQE